MNVLEVEDLRVHFETSRGTVHAVDGLTFHVRSGETLALVGESGCGKSTAAMAIPRLPSRGQRQSGAIKLAGTRLDTLSTSELRKVRGRDIGMIFQEPATSLNPSLKIGLQVYEVLAAHSETDSRYQRESVIELLKRTGIPDPMGAAERYPHQLSGGMRQRVMIAIALACRPKLIIADEPTTALDVTIQAQILELLSEIQRAENTGILLVTHDLGVVAENADRVMVMYAGRKVEEGDVSTVLERPSHPYTRGLLNSVARPTGTTKRVRLQDIPGVVPVLLESFEGCAFAERCRNASEICTKKLPPLISTFDGHSVMCHHPL
ncbi:ABC transporter ATP-binding protein [Aminobacter aminovorans]|uniref:ABC transporter ATP-binding protein n=1 Tax=Aminobacter aminovorans TaxID=83263 RepID=A0AAC9FEU4_AMIAI|nr:ABC transporter ATP-binding protein [Aminobacter aminovorans]AMS45452.1 Putative ABC transporter ATP-binding protein [Aminobacter aminovorans]MBB3708659.1 oligopeptide/dipeptide ABC transporter ATP-binding protein [Aminobacter aminovorans]